MESDTEKQCTIILKCTDAKHRQMREFYGTNDNSVTVGLLVQNANI